MLLLEVVMFWGVAIFAHFAAGINAHKLNGDHPTNRDHWIRLKMILWSAVVVVGFVMGAKCLFTILDIINGGSTL